MIDGMKDAIDIPNSFFVINDDIGIDTYKKDSRYDEEDADLSERSYGYTSSMFKKNRRHGERKKHQGSVLC
jgi:hypothetical protein